MADHQRMLGVESAAIRTGHSRSGLYRAINANKFPKPFKLSDGCSYWFESEIARYVDTLIAGEINRPGAIEDLYCPERFADPRLLFESALWSNVNKKSVSQINTAIRTLSETAEVFRRQLLTHEKNSAAGAEIPKRMAYSNEHQQEHSAILDHACIAWRIFKERNTDDEGDFRKVWQPILDASRAWVDVNDIPLLKASFEHILEIISTAEHQLQILANRRLTDKEQH